MCSCTRNKRPHTEACRAAHRRYVRSPKYTAAKALRTLQQLGASK